jgi:hypothetical protein
VDNVVWIAKQELRTHEIEEEERARRSASSIYRHVTVESSKSKRAEEAIFEI